MDQRLVVVLWSEQQTQFLEVHKTLESRGLSGGLANGNPDDAIGLFYRVRRDTDRFRRRKPRMCRDSHAASGLTIAPAMIDAIKGLAADEAVRKAHAAMRTTVRRGRGAT